MSKQRPGPWNYRLKQEGNGFLITDADDSPFAVVHMTNDPAVAEANARLFAGAQDLLEACKRLEAAVIRHGSREHPPEGDTEWAASFQEVLDSLRTAGAAIKKASGE